MSVSTRPVVRAAVLVLLASALLAPAGSSSGARRSGPVLTVPQATLDAAVTCDDGAGAGRKTVLLVHGTDSSQELWADTYERTLSEEGFGWCTVDLPRRGLADAGVSAEYVVNAARTAVRVSGRRIAMLGHSQGGLLAVWAVKFWPDVAAQTKDVITLGAPVRGTQLADDLCAGGRCETVVWQLRRAADFTSAATNAPLPGRPDFTSIASEVDDVVYPQPQVSSYPGVDAVTLQQVCPRDRSTHGGLLSEPVATALVLDALTEKGPADPERVSPSVCGQGTAGGSSRERRAARPTAPAVMSSYDDHEPPVPAYAARWVW